MNDRKLPLYTRTDGRKVRAVKIQKLHQHHDGGATITPEGGGHHFVVSKAYMGLKAIDLCGPKVGGYFVVYIGRGNLNLAVSAYLPAHLFEAEYTLAEQDDG